MWLRVYTRDEVFHGLIQGVYRHILKSLAPSGSPASTEAAQEGEEGFDLDV
ncbi:hypothetical protein JVT61DRAFT_12153 [Boletus reticuloceps]|uniref:Uncharacterized protein n=1 Tax=Boletus reticuloceps TaxID=495285 RepID=A0A8I2YEH8_9AGAM|nr:hypothetical protein JVT61DRAFT_12153 [Boletus reticuloceps]